MKEYTNLKDKFPFPVFSTEVDSWQEIERLEIPTKYYVMLLLADYSAIDSEEMAKLAKRLITKGLRYVCCWGPESTLGDTGFDIGNILWEEENSVELHLMTTWHDEPLAEAVWFWLYNGTPDDEYWSNCSAVVVNVSQTAPERDLDRMLCDIDYLNLITSDS
jgi:hypothetical protein